MPAPRDFAQPDVRRAWARSLLCPIDDSRWDDLVRELFGWQFAHVAAYRRLCLAHGITPEKLPSWRDIPAVPQQLFKQTILYAHRSVPPAAVYVTSGTTTGQSGRQHLLDTGIYRTVSVEGARRLELFHANPVMHFLTSAPAETPHSSLSAMFGFWSKALHQTGRRFWLRKDHFDFLALRESLLAQINRGHPIAICGTAFSFVHLLDAWATLPPLRLPRGSWVLETGGFKGRSRTVSKAELYAQLGKVLGLRSNAIWNEYGMTELSSQAYASGTNGLHHTPPWARVLVTDAATGREVRVGKQGFIRWIDLANVDSILALQTLDLAERMPNGFRLIGRLPRSEPRGCSLGAEDLIARQETISP